MRTRSEVESRPVPGGARRRVLIDVAIAAVVGLVQFGGTHFAAGHDQPGRYSWDALGVGLLLVGPVALIFRRRWPRSVLALVLASTLAYWIIGYVRGPVFFALIVA